MVKDDTDKSSMQVETKDIGPLFLANFVHQVVNPLNGVIGTLDNINDGTYKGDVVEQKINASRAQLEQCVSLIRNLAYLSDYFFETSGRESLKKARDTGITVLPQVIIEAVQFFQVSGEKKNIRIELDDPATQYKVSARPELIRQVFMNIFDNWIKYGLRDQAVKILTTQNKKNELVIEVTGRSIGFDNNDADRLFDLAFRASVAVGKIAQGSGIGLYVCRQIIEKSVGGKISAHHEKAKSISVFRISIPREKWHI
ncbi:TPA: HAMP domain-containing histidine kinase [Pseudomonas aeruginosa]|uniref:ATP-binding protein n=1 Tax=Pseudomonas aeruginosa TaxID=287 RepID=UPI00106AD35C|nr:HAMP domain-containing histidine kinase [Pseudomonas aeruginosa]